ncbi:MAG: hypothetical protein ACKVP0_15415 [Pirellulaceae bacterium]
MARTPDRVTLATEGLLPHFAEETSAQAFRLGRETRAEQCGDSSRF